MKARLCLIAVLIAVAACSKPAPTAVPASADSTSAAASARQGEAAIDWQLAANDADVDAAFARARTEHKPLFLYWGAKWCPPCNQLKATLFNRMDFIERSRAFVPVYIDGDSPGAQKLGTRFKVRGYPTMVLFSAKGAELTRLPGEVDAQQYTQLLTLGMNAQRPIKAVLADARAGGAGLTPNDWKLLAFYSWETDEQQLVPKQQTAALLQQLAAACPADQAPTATRLLLKAVASPDAKAAQADPALRDRVLQVLADPAAARVHMDVLTNSAADIVGTLSAPKSVPRQQLVQAFDAALKTLEADAGLSRADRITALYARVELVRLDQAKNAELPQSLLADVRAHTARVDREITDGYERQAVITAAGSLLQRAGLLEESDALLEANLAKSHSPYYLMSQLASNARERGDKARSLHWYEQAFAKAEGPATRLQWGSSYVRALVELAPHDEARIEQVTQQLFDEAAAQPNAFYERSARSLRQAAEKLVAWNQGRAHAPVLARLQARLDGVCARLPPDDAQQRDACMGLLKPAGSAPKSA